MVISEHTIPPTFFIEKDKRNPPFLPLLNCELMGWLVWVGGEVGWLCNRVLWVLNQTGVGVAVNNGSGFAVRVSIHLLYEKKLYIAGFYYYHSLASLVLVIIGIFSFIKNIYIYWYTYCRLVFEH